MKEVIEKRNEEKQKVKEWERSSKEDNGRERKRELCQKWVHSNHTRFTLKLFDWFRYSGKDEFHPSLYQPPTHSKFILWSLKYLLSDFFSFCSLWKQNSNPRPSLIMNLTCQPHPPYQHHNYQWWCFIPKLKQLQFV